MARPRWVVVTGTLWLLAMGCSDTALGPVSMAEASRETVLVVQPPAWTRGRLGAMGSFLIPYANNPDILITVPTPLDLPGAVAGLTDAHLDTGLMVGGRYSWDCSDILTISVCAAYYVADTSVDYEIQNPPTRGTYELDELAGVPVQVNLEFGTYATTIPARWFIGVGGGYIWYGEQDEAGSLEPPEDEALAIATTGLEFFGRYNIDVRLDVGHVWLFENRRHQLTTGLSIAYSF